MQIKIFNTGAWDEATCGRHVLPLAAFTRHADAMVFRQKVINRGSSESI